MPLIKLKDLYPNYQKQVLVGENIKPLEVFAGQSEEKIGVVCDDVVDLTGHFRYLVVDTSFWGIPKKILLAVNHCRLDYQAWRLYALEITNPQQVEELPEYMDGITVDYNYDEQIDANNMNPPQISEFVIEQSPEVEVDTTLMPQESQTIPLYAEQATAKKSRQPAGEVIVRKLLQTKVIQLLVPLEKERLVVHRTTVNDSEPILEEITLTAGEVAHFTLYEEKAEVYKHIVLREQVTLQKVTEIEESIIETSVQQEELEFHTLENIEAEHKSSKKS